MQTNFFQSIIAMQVAGDWRINIAKEGTDSLIVSVLFFNDKVGDDARKVVPPMVFKGSATELDEGFFSAIEQPVKQTAQLFTNMEQFSKQLEQAQIQSKMEKDKAVKAAKPKAEKLSKYEEGMQLADTLEAEGKPREAWMKVPDAEQFPEHADTIRERKSALARQFAPDLFNDEPKTEQPC